METWKQIGEIGIDAGLCWIGDPCYILHTKQLPKAIGENWSGFCDKLHQGRDIHTQFNYADGSKGLGVCTSTGHGDGCYPVLVKLNKDGLVAEVKIVFIEN